jgi:hypothetical protein
MPSVTAVKNSRKRSLALSPARRVIYRILVPARGFFALHLEDVVDLIFDLQKLGLREGVPDSPGISHEPACHPRQPCSPGTYRRRISVYPRCHKVGQ